MSGVMKEREAFWREFTRNIRVMQFLGDINDKAKTPAQLRQFDEAREYVRENFDEGVRIMSDSLFAEMRLDFDEMEPGQFSWLASLLHDDSLRAPKFPSVFTPAVVQELIVKIYGAQTTIASTLEEIEPAYRKWLDFEMRIKLLYKAACGLDKEWQTDALFQTSYPEDMFRMVRRLAEYVNTFKLRLEQLNRAYEALSRIITVMEMNPTEMMVRKGEYEEPPTKSYGFGGKRRSGFGTS
jgi:hypothetical protein